MSPAPVPDPERYEPPTSAGRSGRGTGFPHRWRRRVGFSVSAAALTTLAVVGGAVSLTGASGDPVTPQARPAASETLSLDVPTPDASLLADRSAQLSRSTERTKVAEPVTIEALPPVADHEFATALLNVWGRPREQGTRFRLIPARAKVAVTDTVVGHWAQIRIADRVRWVNDTYLAEQRPPKPQPRRTVSRGSSRSSSPAPSASAPSGSAGTTSASAPCPSGSSVESGLVGSAISIHRVICANFPQVASYGGYRPDGEHADGHALDVMVGGDSGTGQAVADFLVANAGSLGVDHVIWSQHIWSQQRSSEGWRYMPDRGSTTANHYDHVHVRVY